MAHPYTDQPTSPLSSPAAPPPKLHAWPALLTLYILSPVIAEMLLGSTPPLSFVNPLSLIAETALYGSGSILVRELVRRRGLGWGNIVLLGAAYGILEEGLVVNSWFNPSWSGLGKLAYYGRFLDTSWVWAVELTTYHAIISITIPILLTELLFPAVAQRPWLGRRGMRGFSIWLAIVSVLMLLGFGFLAFRKQGYTHPPLMFLGAFLLAVGFVWLGLHLRPRVMALAAPTARLAPGLWRLRLLAFCAAFAFFFIAWIVPSIVPWPIVTILLFVGLVVLAARMIARWSRRQGWSVEHQLALAAGVLGFFVPLSALVEFVLPFSGKNMTGLFPVNLVFMIGLAVLAGVVKKRQQRTIGVVI